MQIEQNPLRSRFLNARLAQHIHLTQDECCLIYEQNALLKQ